MHAHPMSARERRGAPPRSPVPFLLLGGLIVVVAIASRLLGSPDSAAVATPSGSGSVAAGDGIAGQPGASTADPASGGGPSASSDVGTPAPSSAPPAASPPAQSAAPSFPGGFLVADRGNSRILVLDQAGATVWRFPRSGSLPRGWASVTADDAFMAPDGRTITANDETHQTIVRIDIATGRVIWTYGRYGRAGSAIGELHTPDDAYPLANGDVIVADIENCRILEIAPNHAVVHQWGRTGVCIDHPPTTFARPNGDTPLPDGGLLITEITGSRVVRLAADGHVVFDIHVPVGYPSDAQLDAQGNVVVADYSSIGQVVSVNPKTGRLVWRWRFASGTRRLDHPSLATPLADGKVSVNDDFRHRLIVIDPRTMRIVWQYGRTDVAGRARGLLNTPDGHQPLPPGAPF